MAELEVGAESPQQPDTGAPALQGRRKATEGPHKTTACMACRKLKIKCNMPTATAPCVRCKRRGLACSVNRPLQMLLHDDAEWKQTVTRKINWLESVVSSLSQKLDDASKSGSNAIPVSEHGQETHQPDVPNNIQLVPLHVPSALPHEDITMDVDSGPATIPAYSVNGDDLGKEGGSRYGGRGSRAGDIISDGIVTKLQAETLFNDYAGRLDHYLYRILGSSSTLDRTRSSSPALLAAICAVAALHSDDLASLYEPCYRRFANLAANLALSENANMDDIRSLCIGAFWLHRLSWNLSSLAVRIATQVHLHRAFRAALKGDNFHFAQIRLYYLVYVCDHHFSIAYGRPPLTRECEEVSRARDILSLPQATEDDARLVSQVELWSITSRVLGVFGFDVESSPSPSLLSRMRRFAIEYDTWRADWNDRFGRHTRVGNYPRKGVKLHVNFAKLYLCSHAFRGPAPNLVPALKGHGGSRVGAKPASQSSPMDEAGAVEDDTGGHLDSSDLEDIATAGVYAAQNILDTVVSDAEIQEHINGLPVYFHTMIAFATVFLFKIATKYSHVVSIDTNKALGLLTNVASILKTVTANMSSQHLLVSVSKAVETLSTTDTQSRHRDQISNPVQAETFTMDNAATPMRLPPWLDPRIAADTTEMTGLNWELGSDFDWMTYDFLAPDGTFVQPDLQDLGEDQGVSKGNVSLLEAPQ